MRALLVRRVLAASVGVVLLGMLTGPAASAKTPPSLQPQIIGGGPVAPGTYPFMTALLNESASGTDYDKQFCGGSLISSDWVLTAAHCVEGASAGNLAVAVGRTILSASNTGQRRAVSQVLVHPQYGTPTGNAHDAALLRLSAAVTIAPVRLAGAADDGYESAGTQLTVIGWGTTKAKGAPVYPDELQGVNVPVVSDTECKSAYGSGLDVLTELCAGAAGIDSCYGDSGGPLFATSPSGPVQMGVVSWGNGCAKRRFPGVYAEVNNAEIRSWITSTAGV